MRIVINPKYQYLKDYLSQINEHFERDGRELHRGRNMLRTLQVDGLTLVVKRYGRMPFTTRLATRFYKSNKAKRAYVSSLMLKERSFDTPEPVAFVSYRHDWLNATYYFVSLRSDYRHSMEEIPSLEAEVLERVTEDFARYAARLHSNGFVHRDFSAGNILFDLVDDRYHFTLLDTNSVKWGKAVSVEQGCANFARLVGTPFFFERLAHHYAALRKADAAQCLSWIMTACDEYRRRPHPHHNNVTGIVEA